MQQQMQQCDTTETMTTTSTSSSYESSSSLSDLSSLDAADNNIGNIIQTPMIWWPECDCKAKPKLMKRAKQCTQTSTKRVTFNDVASFNFFRAGESNDVACC